MFTGINKKKVNEHGYYTHVYVRAHLCTADNRIHGADHWALLLAGANSSNSAGEKQQQQVVSDRHVNAHIDLSHTSVRRRRTLGNRVSDKSGKSTSLLDDELNHQNNGYHNHLIFQFFDNEFNTDIQYL